MNEIEALFNRPVYNNEYIKTKIRPHNENFHGNKKLTRGGGGEYYGHSILLLESICEVEDFSSGTLLKYIMIIIAYLKN